MPRIQTSKNLGAFLDMIAISEGTQKIPNSDDGYRVIVGGTLFDGYADHPRKLVDLGHELKSTAAGRYQLLARYFDAYKHLLNLPDFSPESQDKIALQQIRECHAISAIEAGEFDVAVGLCSHIWASLPGNKYGQPQHKLADLQQVYAEAGGSVHA